MELQTRIVAVAQRNFYRYGFKRVTMSDLARELGISKKTLYKVVPDKQTLVALCVDAVTSDIGPEVAKALAHSDPRSATAPQSTRSAQRFMNMAEIVARLPRLVSPIMVRDLRRDYPALWREVSERRRRMLESVELALVAGQEAGEIRPEIDPRAFIAMLRAVVEQALSAEAIERGEYTIDKALETLMTWIAGGVFLPG